ncbi:MAG: HEAT repeat domain-containing protein [Aggregatilineales bacterium]
MAYVYISRACADSDFARAAAARLSAAGLTARLGEDDQSWSETTDRAIREAFALITIVTPDARACEQMTYEWAFAAGAGVPVVPLVLRPAPLPPRLSALRCFDFTDHSAQPWGALLSYLRRIEQQRIAGSVVLPPDAPQVVRRAVENLDSSSADERRQAVNTLDNNSHPAALDALREALAHSMQDVRHEALFRLARRDNFRDPRAVPALIAALRDGQPDVRAQAVRVLGRIGGDAAILALVDELDDRDKRASAAARSALITLGIDTMARSAVESILRTGSYARFAAAERSLRELGADLRRALYDALDHDDPALRLAAVNMVGASQRLEALPRLLRLLTSPETAAAVMAVLRQWDPVSLVPELLRLSLNERERMRASTTPELPAMSQVREARAARNGALAVEEETAPARAAVTSLPELARAALNALDRRAFPALIAHLGHADGPVRQAAAAALFRHGPAVIGDLQAALHSERSPLAREYVARLLGHLRDPRSVPDLIACLDSGHARLQERAAEALLEIDTEPARRAVEQWHERRQLRR